MILVVGGTKGGGLALVELLLDAGIEATGVGKNDRLPATIPVGIAFYQRDRADEFSAVEKTRQVMKFYSDRGMREGAVVLIGSTSLHEQDGTTSEYRLAKTALKAITKQYAEKYRPIRFNMVSPGSFRHGPMNAKDVAEVVAFFLSPVARFITGQEIVVRA